ncbi:HAD-IB family hydrolase [Pectobacterium polaris]|uniref:HAD-IB family hydrolase n=1 Tax=Pectobacterium polaris TaxID=2042057 RepID=A0AAW5GD19_9GAMM|nr:HAD-IB family hydrolase [Pectobacterium polaris]MCL6351257.1 HAD-IB family hydrolase [Pectobacterium polaris]MCL6368715.1 HAD-IB family hydrolase [Pectobacterium polaris]
MSTEFNRARQVLSVFDFDGTLTYHDSFIPFLRFAFGKRVFARRVMHLVLPSARCIQRKLTRDELKEALIATFLTGIEVSWMQEKAEAFCHRKWNTLMRKSGLLGVAAELHSGAEVTLCSASPEIVLRPFADRLGIKLIGTQLEVENGVLTGKINGHNCRCLYKVERLEGVYGPLSQYHLRAWGDTRGDYELLASAQDAHWRHFHPHWMRFKPLAERLLLSGVVKGHP